MIPAIALVSAGIAGLGSFLAINQFFKKGGSGKPTAASLAVQATVPALPPVVKQADGTISAQELARSLAAEKARAAQLTPEQLKAIDQNAIPGQTVAPFPADGQGGTPLPPGSLKAGDIIPTDRVTISVAANNVPIPAGVKGDFLIRATAFNTDTIVRGVIIDPRIVDDAEHDFLMSSVTGVAPVNVP